MYLNQWLGPSDKWYGKLVYMFRMCYGDTRKDCGLCILCQFSVARPKGNAIPGFGR